MSMSSIQILDRKIAPLSGVFYLTLMRLDQDRNRRLEPKFKEASTLQCVVCWPKKTCQRKSSSVVGLLVTPWTR